MGKNKQFNVVIGFNLTKMFLGYLAFCAVKKIVDDRHVMIFINNAEEVEDEEH